MIEQYRQFLNSLYENNKRLISYNTFYKKYKELGSLDQVITYYSNPRKRKPRMLPHLLEDKQIQEAYDLYINGYTHRRLSERYHVNTNYFQYHFRRLGLHNT